MDGMSDILRSVVQSDPGKFTDELNPFLKSSYLYIYDILWGIKDAWKDKKQINWDKLLDFIEKYIKRNEFWQNQLKTEGSHWSADHEWVLRQIGEIIQEGTKDDSWAFDPLLLPKTEKIVVFGLIC